jgi:tRNA threonylcarbamoyladenosine biosynthesis protein TsaE
MSTTKQLHTADSVATEKLAEKIGQRLKGDEVIELISDLGGGKTTFTRGLSRGAGSDDTVASPTFTISKVYKAPHFEIHHFDFYRLHEPGIMADELAEIVGDTHIVTVVEWGESVRHILPQKHLRVEIAQAGGDGREIVLSAAPGLEYLLEDLK